MRNLEEVISKIEKHITRKDEVREEALRLSRDVVLNCRKTIQRIHRGKLEEAEALLSETRKILLQLTKETEVYPDLYSAGFVENAAQEFVEATCFLSIMRDEDLPDPDTLPVSYNAYLQGLCDLVGELRRKTLDSILDGEAREGARYLSMMEDIYDSILRFDYPSALIPIKRKQDVARSLIEKTRGELAVALCEERMEQQIEEFKTVANQLSNRREVKNNSELDIDRVW